MASSSWCKETVEKINYTKLCRLLVDGGTQAVRSVFDGKHPPPALKTFLNASANKATLQKLKNKTVLNNEQWDKLYPPSGSDPKSEDFDITLLFVLLRNICGLTQPATGWDDLPVTNKRLEDNLAMIKYYRNEIIHKPNTEINNVEFKNYWQDISSALTSLGLSQDDIDDLKSAPLGKKDYNQLLKTQLEKVKSDTADLKSDTADIKTDTSGIKTDTAGIKTDTAGIKTDTAGIRTDTAGIKTDTAGLKSDTTGIKTDVVGIKKDTAGIKTDTANLKSDTAGIKTDTSGIKTDTAGIKSDTADLKSDMADLKSDTAGIKTETAGIKTDTADMKDKIDEISNVFIEAQKRDQAIQKLYISNFSPEINAKCKYFHPNTRQWILDPVESHVDSYQPDSCIMLITAGPGMGKTTIAAKICQTYNDLGCLAACHFFQFSNSTRNNPRLMLQSIARQMCNTVPGYQEALESKLQTNLGKKIDDMNCEELLTVFLEEPLCNVEQRDSNLVVVLDALDECSHDPKDELLKALTKKLPCLPSWLRFILTSRPSTNTSALGSIVAVEIRAEDQSNIKDLELFFSFELKALYPQYDKDENADLVQNLVEMTKGLFLVAFFVIDFLKKEKVASPNKVWELFPNGISSVYENYFSRLKEVLLPYIAEKERFYKMLEALVATNNPLPKNMFYNILGLKSEREVQGQERKKRKDALNSLHWLFPVEGDHVTAFHKSVFDWLTLEKDEEHGFSVRIEDGDEVLASQCNEVLSDLRNGKKEMDKPLNVTLTNSEKYALTFLCHFARKGSSVVKADKFGFFSNFYILTALKIEDVNFDCRITDSIKAYSLFRALRHMIFYFIRYFYSVHKPPCRLSSSRPTSFGCYLAVVLQAAHMEGVSREETTPNALHALNKDRLPYFDENTLLQTPLSLVEECLLELVPSLQYLLKCKEGFINVLPISSDSLSTAVNVSQLDGQPIRKKSFTCKRLITTSPNINFIVAAEENGNKIEILDATTLEVVSQYQSPHEAIETCHVFGDDQGCFIVIKGRGDNKVYVIEGLTGQVRNTITVNEDSTVMDVSCQGHIVVTRTWKRRKTEEIKTFTNKDGEVELMNWKKSDEEYPYTYRELFLYHYGRGQEPIPIYPLAEKICPCIYRLPDFEVDEAVHVSEDGCLLAYHYKDSIFIVNTSDGTLFKRLSMDARLTQLEILFVSGSYLVIIDENFMCVINVKTDETEHRIYLPYPPVTPNCKQYLLLQEEDGKSFNLISNYFKRGIYEVSGDVTREPYFYLSRLVFHNLNLQGLQ